MYILTKLQYPAVISGRKDGCKHFKEMTLLEAGSSVSDSYLLSLCICLLC
jgi:hypothetical protein